MRLNPLPHHQPRSSPRPLLQLYVQDISVITSLAAQDKPLISHHSLPQVPPPKLPSISCSAVPRDGRSTTSQPLVTLSLESQSTNHTLSAPLGPNFSSDSITIALKRNYVLVIIADCWSSETECEPIFGSPDFLVTPDACDRPCSAATATRLILPCLYI